MTISIIVSTYNSPRYLALALDGLLFQTDPDFETIVADDGSSDETRLIIGQYAEELRLIHSWQADCGFRLAASRNRALATASGENVAFLDGDCIPHPMYVEDAKILAANRTKTYVQGHRVILNEVISAAPISVNEIFTSDWRKKNRHHLSNYANALRYPFPRINRTSLKGVRGCSMVFRARDLHEINGFDEKFEGWGHEDKDLVSRFYRSGGRRIDARGRMIVYHLYHPEHPREAESANLYRALSIRPIRASHGLQPVK